MLNKEFHVASPKLRNSARDEECTVRIPGVCNSDPATTVLAHLRQGSTAGMGRKPSDLRAVYACSACHDCLDGRAPWPDEFLSGERIALLLLAVFRTHERMLAKGVIRI